MIKLKIHSLVDIITNSSSEIFVQASTSTIKSVKQIINTFLSIGGSKLTADDIYNFKLVDPNEPIWEDEFKQWNKDNLKKMEAARIKAESKGYDFDEYGWKKDHDYPDPYNYQSAGSYSNIDLEVSIKPDFDGDVKAVKDAAKILSNLSGLFEIEATYD